MRRKVRILFNYIYFGKEKSCVFRKAESYAWSIKLGEREIYVNITHPGATNGQTVSTHLELRGPWFKGFGK